MATMITESFFKNKRVTVFGLGMNMGGVGTVKFLATQGVREIIVTDIKGKEELAQSVEKLASYKNITYVLGQHRPEDFTRVDMVITNPVIPWTNDYIKLAEKNGVPVEMDSSLFFALCKAPIIGVTGSKGKSTTAALIAHILETAKKHVVRAGIGQIGVLGQLKKITKDSVVVFELSSWRLSALKKVKKSPHISVITNIYPDHLNYYKTMAAYVADKKNIFLFQKKNDTLVANFDSETVREIAQDAPGSLVWYSGKEGIEEGVVVEENTIFILRGEEKKILLPLEELPLKGDHNISNVLAAVAACLSVGLTLKQIREGIVTFPGIPHRLEFVAKKKDVRYYNDTAATIPDAAIAALRSFREQVILIAGGSDKKLDFKNFAKEILLRSKGLVLFKGAGTEKLITALREELPEDEKQRKFEIVETMAKAVELATRGAEPGDVVLLSPGAASFGLFKNEFDRGDQFRACVMGKKD